MSNENKQVNEQLRKSKFITVSDSNHVKNTAMISMCSSKFKVGILILNELRNETPPPNDLVMRANVVDTFSLLK